MTMPTVPPQVSLDPHLGGSHVTQVDSYTFLPDIWARLITDHNVKSVLDVGCGSGFSTKWFIDKGLRAVGIEGDPRCMSARRCDPIIEHDFTLAPYVPRDVYDLGWCAEFVEHVEAQFMGNWMAALQKCRYVAMTFARPGQGGWHHVNEQHEPYWLDRFAAFGFDHVPEATAWMRATSNSEPWGRPTLTLFQNRGITASS